MFVHNIPIFALKQFLLVFLLMVFSLRGQNFECCLCGFFLLVQLYNNGPFPCWVFYVIGMGIIGLFLVSLVKEP
jgi:hypothetical protein